MIKETSAYEQFRTRKLGAVEKMIKIKEEDRCFINRPDLKKAEKEFLSQGKKVEILPPARFTEDEIFMETLYKREKGVDRL